MQLQGLQSVLERFSGRAQHRRRFRDNGGHRGASSLVVVAAAAAAGAALATHVLAAGFVIGAPRWSRPEEHARGGVIAREAEFKGVPVSYLEVGQELQGTVVKKYFPGGVLVDVGAEHNGMLEVGEFGDGFPMDGIPYGKGDEIVVRVLTKEEQTNKFYLTMRKGSLERPPRRRTKGTRSQDVSAFIGRQEWFEGEIDHMSAFGVYVRLESPGGDEPVVGLVSKNCFEEGFAKKAAIGAKVRVRVAKVDPVKKYVDLTMLEPGVEQ